MDSERPILDGESLSTGQKATGHCRACFHMYKRMTCRFTNIFTTYAMIDYFQANPDQLEGNGVKLYTKMLDEIAEFDKHTKLMYRYSQPVLRTHAGRELGAREFTLTYSPQWGITDDDARILMVRAVHKLAKYYCKDIEQFEAVGEVTKQGCSHIHGFYKLHGGLKMTDKNFKRAYKYWNPHKKLGKRGHQGGHHEVIKNEADFLGYIDKCPDAWFKFNFADIEYNNASSQDVQEEDAVDEESTTSD